MPTVPAEIADGPYYKVGEYQIDVKTANSKDSSRATVGKTFHAYLELYFQGKHDKQIIDYCAINKIECRKTDGSQVQRKGTDTTFGFYESKGRTACDNAGREMTKAWTKNNTNNTVFVRGQKTVLAVQGVAQPDGYGYDAVSYTHLTLPTIYSV